VLQLLPSGITLILVWWLHHIHSLAQLLIGEGYRGVPESPRWLISKDRSEEAWDILVKYHGEGDPNSEIVKAEYAEMKATIAMDLESKKRTWMELVTSKGNLKRCALVAFIGLFSQWSGNGLVSYYLSRVLETVGIKNKRMQNKVTTVHSLSLIFFCRARDGTY
jgi:hypothetical protein